MTYFTMLVGLPGVGKDTWLTNNRYQESDLLIASSDDKIERYAKICEKTYDDVFQDYVKTATAMIDLEIKEAIQTKMSIIINRTNLTVQSRKKYLSMVPAGYLKTALVFETPDDVEHQRRLNNRPGKTIPADIIESMKKHFVWPTYDEGFDFVYGVKS